MAKKKAVIIGAVFLVVVISALVFLSTSNTFLFSRSLSVKDVTSANMGDDRWFDLYDNDVYFGELIFRFSSLNGGVTKVTFDEPNTRENYVVDSITLKFSSGINSLTDVYIKGNYPAVPTTFAHDSYGTTITLTGMEVYRGGAAPIDFMVQSYRNQSLTITADVTYHQTAFLQLTCLKAHVSVNTQILTN
ncbi:MAG: hypothetical protein ACQCN6_08010 [Candidatus Bathyarchaeia archaeon]